MLKASYNDKLPCHADYRGHLGFHPTNPATSADNVNAGGHHPTVHSPLWTSSVGACYIRYVYHSQIFVPWTNSVAIPTFTMGFSEKLRHLRRLRQCGGTSPHGLSPQSTSDFICGGMSYKVRVSRYILRTMTNFVAIPTSVTGFSRQTRHLRRLHQCGGSSPHSPQSLRTSSVGACHIRYVYPTQILVQ